jgi:hypothetical protein
MTARTARGAGWRAVKETGHGGHTKPPIDLARGYLPVLVVTALLGFAMMIAYQAGAIMQGYSQFQISTAARFATMEQQLNEIRSTLAQIRDRQK